MDNIRYTLSSDGQGFHADMNGRPIGEITFVRVGGDKFIIDHTAVDNQFRNRGIGCALVRRVVELARSQNRKIIALCPFALAMFNRHPEFSDVRLMQNTR